MGGTHKNFSKGWLVGTTRFAVAAVAVSTLVATPRVGWSAHGQPTVVLARGAPLAVESGLVSPSEGWVANGYNLYLTTNAGRSWRGIGPKEVANDDAVARMEQFFARDATHFWLTVGGVSLPGGRCTDGTCREARSSRPPTLAGPGTRPTFRLVFHVKRR